MHTRFHIALRIRNIDEAKEFYGEKLGFKEDRSSAHTIVYNMYGHQLVLHIDKEIGESGTITNSDQGGGIQVPHFGAILPMDEWKVYAAKLKAVNLNFMLEPNIRNEGKDDENATMFFADPSGNVIEFKTFKDIDKQIFNNIPS
ncbi:MAG: glyoxalase [Planctomycetota bacterium]|nr:MAG: glyoxalase [Planctomycetota bacterium]